MGKPESMMTPEEIKNKRATHTLWRKRHHRHLSRYAKTWRDQHPDKQAAYSKKYLSQPGKRAAMNAKYAAWRRGVYQANRRALIIATGGKCIRCGYDKCFSALEFHHRAREQKSFSISSKALIEVPPERLLEEARKCDLLCANCHREEHAAEDSFTVRGKTDTLESSKSVSFYEGRSKKANKAYRKHLND